MITCIIQIHHLPTLTKTTSKLKEIIRVDVDAKDYRSTKPRLKWKLLSAINSNNPSRKFIKTSMVWYVRSTCFFKKVSSSVKKLQNENLKHNKHKKKEESNVEPLCTCTYDLVRMKLHPNWHVKK